MTVLQEFIWGFYIIFLVLYFLQGLKKSINLMPLTLSFVGNIFVGRKGGSLIFENLNPDSSKGKAFLHNEESPREKKLPCQEKTSK